MSRQALLAFGFDAFGQCSSASKQERKANDDPLCHSTPQILARFQSDRILGIAATWSLSIAWSAQTIYLWGFVESFTGVSGSRYAQIDFKRGASDAGPITKVSSTKNSPTDKEETVLLVLIENHLVRIGPQFEADEPPPPTKKVRKEAGASEGALEANITFDTGKRSLVVDMILDYCIDVAATAGQVAAIEASGQLRIWASGMESGKQVLPTPSKMNQVCFKQLSAGASHFLAVSDQGTLYTWGSHGARGQLGHGSVEIHPREEPQIVEALEGLRVVSAKGGGNHSAVSTSDGVVYTFGCSEDGQLGLEEDTSAESEPVNHALPSPLEFDFANEEAVSIACGARHTLAADATALYGCGWNKYGQIGEIGFGTSRRLLQPCELPIIGRHQSIKAIAAGGWHSLVLLEYEDLNGSDLETGPVK
ncbi:regulator of chromosome condensation 1/beta-lactamase-inhibitor protein II [Phlyctochytrium arcticum]|nr:regulator of chromosome condensation 1/beta-lactamase-inhibitor protein II [Phlyctochytrium arcticum]